MSPGRINHLNVAQDKRRLFTKGTQFINGKKVIDINCQGRFIITKKYLCLELNEVISS